jgi:hypothetical protein
MTYANDVYLAQMKYEAELAAATTQAAATTASIRYHRRVLAAERNDTNGNTAGSAGALLQLGVDAVPVDDVAYGTAKTAHEGALATLVADGASPTQAHVTAVNLAYQTLKVHVGARINFVAADKATFEAALATCVADGASPTQAHVNSANSAYTTFKANLS